MNRDEQLEYAVSVTGRVFGRSPLWPMLVVAVVVTVLAPMLVMTMPQQAEALLPFTAVPVLGAYAWMVFHARSRSGTLRLHASDLELRVGNTDWTGRVVRTELVPWLLAGLGTVHGAILLLHTVDAAGKERTLSLAAPEVAAPANAHGTKQPQPVMFTDTVALRELIAQLHTHAAVTDISEGISKSNVFLLVRRPGFTSSLRTMGPWFGTMLTVSVLGVLLGDVMTSHPMAPALIGALLIGVIGVGMWRTIHRASQPKPQFVLTVGSQDAQLHDPNGKLLWRTSRPHMPVTRETYVYRTKYGSHRFPVLAVRRQQQPE
jgi:hypothetical protein